MNKYIEFLVDLPTETDIVNGATNEFCCFKGEKKPIIDETKKAYYFIKGDYKFGMPKKYEGKIYIIKNTINESNNKKEADT